MSTVNSRSRLLEQMNLALWAPARSVPIWLPVLLPLQPLTPPPLPLNALVHHPAHPLRPVTSPLQSPTKIRRRKVARKRPQTLQATRSSANWALKLQQRLLKRKPQSQPQQRYKPKYHRHLNKPQPQQPQSSRQMLRWNLRIPSQKPLRPKLLHS